MKRVFFFVCLLGLLLSSSCSNEKKKIYERISLVSADALYAKIDDVELYCYPKIGENPSLADGFVGKQKFVLSFKIVFSDITTIKSAPLIEFKSGETRYFGDFEYKPLSSSAFADFEVTSRPQDDLTGRLTINGVKKEFVLRSTIPDDLLNYKKALDKTIEFSPKELETFFNEEENFEIKIILDEQEKFYGYRIYFIGEKDFIEYLTDARTGEILVKRE